MVEDAELRRRCAAAAVETARRYRMEAIGPMWDDLLREVREERAANGVRGVTGRVGDLS
jgi:hypothetical protein